MSVDREVSLTNTGIIKHVELVMPEKGGIVFFKGRNGVGKTTAVNALKNAIDGKGPICVRDGEEKAEVSFLGVTIRAGKKTRYSGCLQVDSLEGKFSIGDVINPGFSDPVANDRRAVLGILQVAGAKADPSLFYELVGSEDQFRKVVTRETLKETDLVSMSSRLKRDFEASARNNEADATEWTARIEGLESTLPAEDAEEDGRSLVEIDADLKTARGESLDIRSRQRMATAAIESFEKKMADFQAGQSESISPAQAAIDADVKNVDAAGELTAAERLVSSLQEQLAEAKKDLEVARSQSVSAFNAWTAAVKHAEDYKSLKELVEAGRPREVPESEVVAADEKISELQGLLQKKKNAESTEKTKREIGELKGKVKLASSMADMLRGAAQSVDSVLTEMISKICPAIRYENERLITTTERGDTFFHDPSGTNGLSTGQRTKLVIDIAATAVGEGGVIVDDGDYCQDLDPIALEEVAEHARLRSVTIVTTMCTTDEELTTEVM